MLALPVHDHAPPLVSIRDLRVSRGGRIVLSDLNCDISRGKITAIVGLNGCGKSTLLRTLVGEFSHTGLVRFSCGEDHSRPRPDHVGYVPQRLAIEAAFPITVRDLFGLALQRRPVFFGVSRAVIRRMLPSLKRVGLSESILDRPMEGLSGGELQRVLLALALEPQPELLLLDEPASGIDFKDRQSFYDLISRLNHETGVSVVLVSHDLAMMASFAHEVVCLRGGRVICQGPPGEVLSRERIAELFGESIIT